MKLKNKLKLNCEIKGTSNKQLNKQGGASRCKETLFFCCYFPGIKHERLPKDKPFEAKHSCLSVEITLNEQRSIK